MAHSNSTAGLSAGVKALSDGSSTFAHTQAMWRFLGNEAVTPDKLAAPLLASCHEELLQCEGDWALCIHDWSRIHYGGHVGKKDRLQMTHAKDIGYELQSSLVANAQDGKPLSVVAQNLVCQAGVWSSRKATLQPNDQTHLDELSTRMEWIEQQQLGKRLVHMVDREGDSVEHMRQWSRQGFDWLVRVKAGSHVCLDGVSMSVADAAKQVSLQHTRQVVCKGQTCLQWTGSTTVALTRKAKPARTEVTGQRVNPVAGVALAVRLVVSQIRNADGDMVSQWYLLSNVGEQVEDAQLALWYYFRWQIETFFKLLKSAGHQVERWGQETARAIFNRILIATQACTMTWRLMQAPGEQAAQTRAFLVRLSGRQMKRTRPVTLPALLDGMFTLFTMLDALEHYSISDLKEFANIAKKHLTPFKEPILV